MPENRSPEKPQFISRVRAAEMLDCSVQLIDKFIRENRLRGFHVGRKVIVRQDELLHLLEEIR